MVLPYLEFFRPYQMPSVNNLFQFTCKEVFKKLKIEMQIRASTDVAYMV